MNVDFYDDGGHLLFQNSSGNWRMSKFASLVSSSEYVGDKKLSDTDYAVVIQNEHGNFGKLPMVDQGNTAISAYYLCAQADSLPEDLVKVAAINLITGMLAFNMTAPEKLVKLAGLKKATDAKACAPYVKMDKEKEKKKESKEKTASMDKLAYYKQAVQRYNEDYPNLTPIERAKGAVQLERVSLESQEGLRKEAQLYLQGEFSPEKLSNSAAKRYEFSEEPAYLALSKQAHAVDFLDGVRILQELDAKTGMTRFWDHQIEDPVRSSLRVPTKTAEVIKVAGVAVTKEQLQELVKTGTIKKQFGAGFEASFAKDPMTVYKSLPDPTKDIIAGLVRGK